MISLRSHCAVLFSSFESMATVINAKYNAFSGINQTSVTTQQWFIYATMSNFVVCTCALILGKFAVNKFAVGKLTSGIFASGNFAAVKFCTLNVYPPPCTFPSTVHCPVHLHTGPAPSVYTAFRLLGETS